MLRKLVILIPALFLSAVAIANPMRTFIDRSMLTANFQGDTYYLNYPGNSLWAMGKLTFGVFVKPYRKSGNQTTSDPVLLNCDGVLTLLQPGTGAFCKLSSHENHADVDIPKDKFNHGSDVLITVLENVS